MYTMKITSNDGKFSTNIHADTIEQLIEKVIKEFNYQVEETAKNNDPLVKYQI